MGTERGALSAGRCLGRYRIIRALGAGQAGQVFLAMDDASQRPVALKVLTPTSELETQRHSQALSALAHLMRDGGHAHVAAILDAGVQRPFLWVAMELAPGCELVRYTAPSRLLPEPVALACLAKVAQGLAWAHQHGVMHRDIKPANIMVELTTGSTKLLDFGLARLAAAEQTRTGVVLGSPAYMAPEQLSGASPTPQGDLYAVGVVLFQLLTARLPFDHHNMGELLRQVAQQEPPPLSLYRADLPLELQRLVGSLLSKRVAQRPSSAHELAQQLAALAARC